MSSGVYPSSVGCSPYPLMCEPPEWQPSPDQVAVLQQFTHIVSQEVDSHVLGRTAFPHLGAKQRWAPQEAPAKLTL